MRFSLACAALTASVFAAGTARAQTSTGSCMGMDNSDTLAGTVGLAVPNSNGNGTFESVQAAAIPYVFDNAECVCPPDSSQQINLEIQLTQSFSNAATPGTVEVWVGSGCDNYTTRTTAGQNICEKLTTGLPSFQDFTTASNAGLLIHIPIPGNALASPVLHTCSQTTVSNSIYVFIYTNASMPFASCTLSGITEQNQGPTPVSGISAGPGDGAVTLRWTAPTQTSLSPTSYQVLCADDCGNPIKSSPNTPQYSTCVNGVLKRRTIPTGGTTPTSGTDAGVTTDDAGTSLIPPADNATTGVEPRFEPADITACAADMGPNTIFSNPDMGNAGPLADLDPKFACSSMIGATSNTARITGLTNNHPYHFVVLAIDNFGNATPSEAVVATPQPTEDLYRRYRDAGGAPGGCFIATAAFGSYESDWVYILRDFRDEVLLPSAMGHGFVDWYYAHSPPAAAWIAERGWARSLTRAALLPVIAGAFFWVYFAAWQKALFLTLLLALVMRKRIVAAIERGQRA